MLLIDAATLYAMLPQPATHCYAACAAAMPRIFHTPLRCRLRHGYLLTLTLAEPPLHDCRLFFMMPLFLMFTPRLMPMPPLMPLRYVRGAVR